MRILVIDDELAMRSILVESLRAENYHVESAEDGEAGLEKVFAQEFDLVLLDVMMPRIDGFTVCSEIRKRGLEIPVLMLTARGMVDDRVKGLDCGADDYLVKPFSLKELLARVRALTRRKERDEFPEEFKLGTTTINLTLQTCRQENQTQKLSSKETGLLKVLLQNIDQAVSRDRFLDEVWGYDAYPSPRTVDNFITQLRKKLGVDGKHLETIHGKGYRISSDQIS